MSRPEVSHKIDEIASSATPARVGGRRETSSDKTLSIMDLFTPTRPEWSIEEMVTELRLSHSTVYRYVRSLVSVGLIFTVRQGRYLLGPGIVHYDRQLRLADPLIHAAQPILRQLANELPAPGLLFIARVHRDHVMSMFEERIGFTDFPTSYDRGKLMPLYSGAPALAILAHLPIRKLKRAFLKAYRTSDAAEAWSRLRRQLRITRNRGYAIDTGGIDPELTYLAVSLLHPDGGVAGSLTLGMQTETSSDSIASRAAQLNDAAGQIAVSVLRASGLGPADAD
jgi:DNA-binding IclR family transcriptional regulator